MGIGGEDNTAFAFEGRWQEFLPIGLTNALLNLVTLGVYRFWATTKPALLMSDWNGRAPEWNSSLAF
jgi:hypothetical protein